MILTDSKTPTSPTSATSEFTDVTEIADPPAYSPSESTINRPPVNYLHINDRQNSIKGAWNLDSSMPIPPSLLPPMEDGEALNNLKLKSRHGAIRGSINLVGIDPKTRATIEARSVHNTVYLEINRERPTQRFSVVAYCDHNNVTVKIPRDFRGPITFRNKHVSTKFSRSIEQNLTPFTKDGKIGRGFIGDWQGVTDIKDWEGDELDVGSEHNTVYVTYLGEMTESEIFWQTWRQEGTLGMIGRWIKGKKPAAELETPGAGSSTSVMSGPPPLPPKS